VPELLEDYVRDFKEHGHEYLIVVAGDLKTPSGAEEYCQGLDNVVYLSPDDQKREFGQTSLYKYIPFNSIDRRNFAYLYCLRNGINENDTMITIDDDNYLWQEDFIGLHSVGVRTAETVTADMPTWINPLEEFYEQTIFMRGCSPFEHESNSKKLLQRTVSTSHTAVNQGLWNGSPDVDALTRLSGNKEDITVKRNESIVVKKNIMCPFDTQNTAYLNGFAITAFLPTYIGRHDDIYSSFITKKIADHFNFGVSYGKPVVHQDRNDHDDCKDFLLELHGMSWGDNLNYFLQCLNLRSDSLIGAYAEISDELKGNFHATNMVSGRANNTTKLWSIGQIAEGMRIWIDTIGGYELPNVVKQPSVQMNVT